MKLSTTLLALLAADLVSVNPNDGCNLLIPFAMSHYTNDQIGAYSVGFATEVAAQQFLASLPKYVGAKIETAVHQLTRFEGCTFTQQQELLPERQFLVRMTAHVWNGSFWAPSTKKADRRAVNRFVQAVAQLVETRVEQAALAFVEDLVTKQGTGVELDAQEAPVAVLELTAESVVAEPSSEGGFQFHVIRRAPGQVYLSVKHGATNNRYFRLRKGAAKRAAQLADAVNA